MTPLRAFSLVVAVVFFVAGLAWGVYTAARSEFQPEWVASFWTLAGMAYSYAYFAKWYEKWVKE
ncbi:MAG: hypothetical protein ACO2PM_16215 [Pyrobaculum sp.]|jgi:hypothetical protein